MALGVWSNVSVQSGWRRLQRSQRHCRDADDCVVDPAELLQTTGACSGKGSRRRRRFVSVALYNTVHNQFVLGRRHKKFHCPTISRFAVGVIELCGVQIAQVSKPWVVIYLISNLNTILCLHITQPCFLVMASRVTLVINVTELERGRQRRVPPNKSLFCRY